MIKDFLIKRYQSKINRLNPPVAIILHREIPVPSAQNISHLAKIVSVVNSFEEELRKKPDSFFREKTEEYKRMIAEKTAGVSEEEFMVVLNQIFDEIMPFYFAMVRESARRTINMRHFDVQILGGIVLHQNKIAEMATGEGKTLVATLAASLNALVGKGVHIVTVNDYLARRDCEWMGPVYRFLGLSVGVIQHDMSEREKKSAYMCDITYGTNNEFGFDYLRDNMVTSLDDVVQREHFYAIVDEVDSILIDEARTPLIISGPAEVSTQKYYMVDRVVRQLKKKIVISLFENKERMLVIKNLDGTEERMSPSELENKYDAVIEEKTHSAYLTKKGEEKCEKLLGIKDIYEDFPDGVSNNWAHYITQSLRAHQLFKRDRDYIVKDGKVVIVDEFTGRLMPGRRWSDGLHQLVEAKENLKIQEETQTLATITLQNYFRMYKKLAGMTGTAYTEAAEFKHIYKLDVVVIPTNRPLMRTNYPDRIYKTKQGKFNAVVKEIEELYNKKRPVLVGTISIDDSEGLSFMLKRKGIPHHVLNAKYHEAEAFIVAQAGRLGQVTIATNMAGRGTDIILGGNVDYFIKDILRKSNINPEDERYREEYEKLYRKYYDKFEKERQKVVELGGLHIIGTQRHESRRIDNQLRGRAGRQGDPGSSRFYVSLEDDLMRLFGSERIYMFMDRLGFSEDQPIEHPWVTRSLAVAQKRVENYNFEVRKELLKFDDVMNKQRSVIYKQRREILEKQDIKEEIIGMLEDVVDKNVPFFCDMPEKDLDGLIRWCRMKFGLEINFDDLDSERISAEEIKQFVFEKLMDMYDQKETEVGKENMRYIERMVSLWVIDSKWKEQLLTMDSLKEGIHLRGFAQIDPIIEYQREAFRAFNDMVDSLKENIVELIFRYKPLEEREVVTVFSQTPQDFKHEEYSSLQKRDDSSRASSVVLSSKKKKVGRNDPCPCGSGKKYKRCCGR